jgi:geranylgeranyl diphosphate synthase type I
MNETTSQEEITEQLLKLLEERGRKALEMARKTVLEEKIESKEVQEALTYFMTEFWHDVTRPALLSLVCEAVGGDPDITTPIAISITLISGATGIHDDIIDQSKTKGSRPTVLGKFGQDIALLVGDALLFKGFTVLYEAVEKGVPAKKIAAISDIINRTFFELGNAEALALKFRGRTDVTPEDYLCIVRKKAADIEAYTRISAILGDGSEEEIEALGEYGRLLGMLGILRADMIDMLDLEETIHRIKKEHLSLVIVYALQNPEMNSILRSLLKKTVTLKDAEKLSTFVDKAGGFIHMEECMNKLAEEAHIKIEKIKYNREYLKLLVQGMLLPEWRSYLNPPIPDG